MIAVPFPQNHGSRAYILALTHATATCTRSRRPVLARILLTYLRTLAGSTMSRSAISAFENPSATREATSASRGVSNEKLPLCVGALPLGDASGEEGKHLPSTLRVILGVSTASPEATARTASASSAEVTSLSRNPDAPADSPPSA